MVILSCKRDENLEYTKIYRKSVKNVQSKKIQCQFCDNFFVKMVFKAYSVYVRKIFISKGTLVFGPSFSGETYLIKTKLTKLK